MSEAVAPATSERMTWEQICEAYAGEWVLMVDVDWVNDTDLDLRSAVVVSHGKHRQWSRAKELIPDGVDCTHLFIFKPGYEDWPEERCASARHKFIDDEIERTRTW